MTSPRLNAYQQELVEALVSKHHVPKLDAIQWVIENPIAFIASVEWELREKGKS
jgi:hypothetical protein